MKDADCPQGFGCKATQCVPPPCGPDAACPKGHMCTGTQCQPIGDPALILGVPVKQWRQAAVFLTPAHYAFDYVNIVAADGVEVSLDGQPIAATAFEPVGTTGYQVYRGEVKDGVHRISATAPVGVTVYGYDKDISYGYPGAMGIEPLIGLE